MGLDCGGVCAKVVLVIINIIYMLVGICVTGFGVFFLIHRDKMEFLTGSDTVGGSVALITGGVFTLVVAVLGIVAAASELYPLLITYVFFMLALVGLQVVGAILSFVNKGKIQERAGEKFKEYISEYRDPTDYDYNEEANDIVDAVQEALECCGLNGPQDWVTENPNFVSSYGVPDSCVCDSTDCLSILGIDTRIWNQGCNESLNNIIALNSVVLGASAFGVVLVEIVTMLISIALCACIMSARSLERRSNDIHSIAYMPLESYPTNTITNQFVPDNVMPGDVKIQ